MLFEAPPPPPAGSNPAAPHLLNPRGFLLNSTHNNAQPPPAFSRPLITTDSAAAPSTAVGSRKSSRTAFQDITNSASKKDDAAAKAAYAEHQVALSCMSPNYIEMMRAHNANNKSLKVSSPLPAVPQRQQQHRSKSKEQNRKEGSVSQTSTTTQLSDAPLLVPPPPPPRCAAPSPFASPTKSTIVPPPPPLIAILERQQQAAKGDQQQPPQQRTVNPRQQFMVQAEAHTNTNNNSGSYGGRDVPPPPPLLHPLLAGLAPPATASHSAAPSDPKVLTKYHFLKNFSVHPKTPGSKEKAPHSKHDAAAGGRRRRGDMSPLPVAPQVVPEEHRPDEAARASRPLMATAHDHHHHHPPQQHHACHHHNHQENHHRTIATLGPAHQRPKETAVPSPSPLRSHPKPSSRMGALAALPPGLSFEGSLADSQQRATPLTPPSPNKKCGGQGRRRNMVTGPSAAAGVAVFLEQHQHLPPPPQQTRRPPAAVFPTPMKQREVARSLMDDLDEMMSPRAQQQRCLAAAAAAAAHRQEEATVSKNDWDAMEDVEDVASPLLAVQQPAVEANLSTPLGGSSVRRRGGGGGRPPVSSGTGPRDRHRGVDHHHHTTTSDGGYPADNDMSSPSMLLPSPTTLGSASPSEEFLEDEMNGTAGGYAARMLLSGGDDYPPSVASTVQGEFDLGGFEDDDYVSPMTEDDGEDHRRNERHNTSPPAPLQLCLEQREKDGGDSPCAWSLPSPSSAATVAFATFFAASGFGAPSAVSVQSQKWEQEHSRFRMLLLQNYTKNLLLGMLEQEEFVQCAVTSFVHAQEAALQELYTTKLRLFFDYGYASCVGIPMVVAMEWHGRLLEKMRRDLFMRAMVRKFLKTTPRKSTKSSPQEEERVRVRCAKGIASLNGRHQQYSKQVISSSTTTPSATSSGLSAPLNGWSRSDDDDNDDVHEKLIGGTTASKPPTGRKRGGCRRGISSRGVSPSSSAASRSSGGEEGDEPAFSAL